jgi:hypothetical protein
MINNKSLGFLGLGVLFVLALLSFASATITFSSVPTLLRSGNSFTISVTSNVTETIDFTATSITTANGKIITFTPLTAVSFTGNASVPETKTVIINYTVPSDSQFTFGTSYSTTLTADGASSPDATTLLSFEDIPSEYLNNNNSLAINIDDTSVEEGFGDDQDWFALDKIRAKIDVENNGNERIKSIVVYYGLYDTTNDKWIFKNKESSFSLNDDDDKPLTVNFQLTQLSKFDLDTADYKFYAWATGTDEDGDKKTSVTAFEDIEMQFENDFVVLDNIQILNSESVSCGDEVKITADVVNIGTDDQQDVYVKITNTKLGINNQKVQIGDIDSMDTSKLEFAFTVSEDVTPGTYEVQFGVYDESDDVYVTSFGDDDSVLILPIVIAEGTCTNELPVEVFAELESVARVGEEFTVRATITNTASTAQTFNLELSDYTNWASLVSMDKTSVTLNAGSSQDVLIKLKANNDASGEQNFNIVLKQGTKTISQPVSVSVEKPGFNITGLFTGLGSGNTYLWVIGALNVLLVFIIIIVAVRVVRKK